MAERAWLTHHEACENCGAEGAPKDGPSIYCTVGQELADVTDHYSLELQDSPEGLLGFCTACNRPGSQTGEDLRGDDALCVNCKKDKRSRRGRWAR